MRTRLKNATETIGTPENPEALRLAVKRLDMAASKRVIHPRQAARKKSRLMKKIMRRNIAIALGELERSIASVKSQGMTLPS